MTLLLPESLWLLLLLPFILALYLWIVCRRSVFAIRYPSLALAKAAGYQSTLWRRHMPFAITLIALALLVLAAARPTALFGSPVMKQEILLAMDVSVSMLATDVLPDRLRSSQRAAKKFIEELPPGIRVGVIAYGGTAHVVQKATASHADAIAAVEGLKIQRSTAIGSAILLALNEIFPDESFWLPDALTHSATDTSATPSEDWSALAKPPNDARPGSYRDAAIVLLTDGRNTAGASPTAAAFMAADKGVRIFTVGFGTEGGSVVEYNGVRMRVRLDEPTLRAIATQTLGRYYPARDGTELDAVYKALSGLMVMERRETEISFLLAAIAAFLVAVATVLSLLWSGRVG